MCSKEWKVSKLFLGGLLSWYPGVLTKLVLISDGSFAAKLESVYPHLVLTIGCISHFSSQSSKKLRTQSKCPTPKTHVQCFPNLHHHLQCLLTYLCHRHQSQHQRRHYLLLRHRYSLCEHPRNLLPRQFRRHMGNHIPLCDISIQAPQWYISASLSSISHIQPTWIPTYRHHRILYGHWLFPTIEKLKDNRMTMRGEPTLPRNHEPMIPRNYQTTWTTSPQKAAKKRSRRAR